MRNDTMTLQQENLTNRRESISAACRNASAIGHAVERRHSAGSRTSRVVEWRRTDNPDIVAIQQYIEENYMKRITLEALSRQFFISSSYLCELFRKTTGTTLISYVMMTRMERAIALMREPLSLYAIAEQVGYANYGYFARLFKQFHGISPEQYRNGISTCGLRGMILRRA